MEPSRGFSESVSKRTRELRNNNFNLVVNYGEWEIITGKLNTLYRGLYYIYHLPCSRILPLLDNRTCQLCNNSDIVALTVTNMLNSQSKNYIEFISL